MSEYDPIDELAKAIRGRSPGEKQSPTKRANSFFDEDDAPPLSERVDIPRCPKCKAAVAKDAVLCGLCATIINPIPSRWSRGAIERLRGEPHDQESRAFLVVLSVVWIVALLVLAFLLFTGNRAYPREVFLLGVGLLVWPIPAFIASARRHPNVAAITALTFLAGWTGIGWIIAVVWAYTVPSRARDRNNRY